MRDYIERTSDPNYKLEEVTGYLLCGDLVDTYSSAREKGKFSKFTNLRQAVCGVIPFLNKNVALRSETHRAISFSAFCAFRGKSRGRDAPPTMTDINE